MEVKNEIPASLTTLQGFVLAVLACAMLIAVSAGARSGEVPGAEAAWSAPFANPEMVQILGYDDNQGNSNDAMEPFISRDGNYLFFNNSNNPAVNPDTNLFWATRIDDVTFQYQGQIAGVNSTALDAVPSIDSDNNFYFITTRSYFNTGTPGYLSTIYSGPFSGGSVSAVNPVAGVAAPKLGLVIFDAEISDRGNTLYFTQGDFSTGKLTSTTMKFATRDGDKFVVSPKSAKKMANINSGALNYAADTSASELEIFFTRATTVNGTLKKGPAIYMASRASTSQPFGKPHQITAITGFAEAPSISPDGQSLYYHWMKPNGLFVINRVTRTLAH